MGTGPVMFLQDQLGTGFTQDSGAAATTGVGLMNYLDAQQATEFVGRLHVLTDGRVDLYKLKLAGRWLPFLYFLEIMVF